jgi:hypothetical protein
VKYIFNKRFVFINKRFVFSLLCSIIVISGCSRSESQKASPQFLMKTALISVSSIEFSEELELKKAAYPYDINTHPVEYNEMVIHLVKILSDEIVLLTAAADKNIIVSDQEIQSAEKEFKKDYPLDSFKQILLKNAISYSLWKKRFKKNMIIQKLIDQELKQKIEINPVDIVEFYEQQKLETRLSSEKNTVVNKINNEKELIKQLRIKKTQKSYNKWIQDIDQMYPVEINEKELKLFLMDIKKNRTEKNEKKN